MRFNMIEQMHKIYEQIWHLNIQMLKVWLEHIVFTWRWWLGILLTIIPWALWIYIRKKESTHRLLFVGFFIIILSSFLDLLGTTYHIWEYRYQILPFHPPLLPFDFSLLPVMVMLLLQYKPNMKPFTKGIFLGGFTAFVAEPLLHWLGFYNPLQWKYIYSFFIYIVIYLIADRISKANHFNKI